MVRPLGVFRILANISRNFFTFAVVAVIFSHDTLDGFPIDALMGVKWIELEFEKGIPESLDRETETDMETDMIGEESKHGSQNARV